MRFRVIPFICSGLLLGSITAADAASVGTGGVSGAFAKNSTSLRIGIGSGSSFNDNYTILSIGLGYYIASGLEIGVEAQQWFSGNPSITQLSPQLRYVFSRAQTIKPYVGTFYRRTYIEGLEDVDSFGYRAGAFVSGSNGVYVGGGVVYEEYTNCNFDDCSTTYPEVIVSFSF